MQEPLVYLKGKLIPQSEAHIAIYDFGVVLGATVTEMVRTFRHELFRLEEHVARLYRSLKMMRFDIKKTQEEFIEILRELVDNNLKLISEEDDLGLVIFVTPGENPTYAGGAGGSASLSPTVCAHTFPMPFELWADKMVNGLHLVIPSTRHVPPQCFDPNMKYRSRMHYYLADQEARLVDPSASALLLDLDGNVTETSGANFLIVENGTIVSPGLRNTLAGASRHMVIDLAAKLGIPFEVRDFQTFNAINADEAMTTSTPYCVMPVTQINGLPIGDGEPGPITQKLWAAWSEEVGFDICQQIQEGARRRTGNS